MLSYILRRLLGVIPVMVVVGIFVFSLLHLAPGDPAAIIAGDTATQADIARIRTSLGLDRPLLEQFSTWGWATIQGDLGVSMFSNIPVTELMAQRMGPTVSLAFTTMLVAVVIAITLGVLAAWKAGSLLDRAVMGLAVTGFSVPVFVVGYIMVYFIALKWRLLPVQGYMPMSEGFWPWLRHLILPSFALGLGYVALIARITRGSMLEVLSEDYIRTAAAKGVSTVPMLLRHALKNAAVPIITVIGIGVALLISGVVITESVFNIPGIGRLVVDAISRRDYPIIQGVMVVFAAVYVLINLVIDIAYSFIDPRIRYS
ncbi:MAG: ABC transporter permease [Rhodoferax sp.]|jgi:peptide/nickel transport system permease protein|nr:ABC transporter permease [Rhodoferax sp.]